MRRTIIAVVLGMLVVFLLGFILLSYGFNQKFFIVLTILGLAPATWRDGFQVRRFNRKALIDRLLLPILILVILPLIYVLLALGLQHFLSVSGLILFGIVCWTAGLVYGRKHFLRNNILVAHLPFSLVTACTLFYILTAYGFAQVFLFIALFLASFILLLLYFSEHQNSHETVSYPVIYSQVNWSDEFQQMLAVEVSTINGRLSLREHKTLLRERYRSLAEKSLLLGHHPEDIVKDFLQVLPAYLPSDDAGEIADSLIESPEFKSVISRRDDLLGYNLNRDQKKLRRIFEGTDLVQIVRLLKECY